MPPSGLDAAAAGVRRDRGRFRCSLQRAGKASRRSAAPFAVSLLEAFPPGARLIEIGGGTGEDALWLADRAATC